MKLYFVTACLADIWKEASYIHQYALYIGTGALILTFYLDHSKNKTNYAKLFLLFIVVFSFFEYLVGFIMEALFAEVWWDYSYSDFNLNGRITALNSFLWGVVTVLFARFIYPLIRLFKEKVVYKIPCNIQIILMVILISWISIDFTLSCVRYLN